MTDEQKAKCREICKHYGNQNQCLKAIEEMSELQQAIVKVYIGDNGDLDHVIEEIADVCIMMEQLKFIFDPIGIDMRMKINMKLNRQLKRMESENDPDVRLIDANKAQEYLYEHLDDLHMIAAMNAINEMPTVDAKPIIRAHWIMLDERVGQCSNCGYCQKSNGIDKTGHGNIHKAVYKWCTACGAKMDGGDSK